MSAEWAVALLEDQHIDAWKREHVQRFAAECATSSRTDLSIVHEPPARTPMRSRTDEAAVAIETLTEASTR